MLSMSIQFTHCNYKALGDVECHHFSKPLLKQNTRPRCHNFKHRLIDQQNLQIAKKIKDLPVLIIIKPLFSTLYQFWITLKLHKISS